MKKTLAAAVLLGSSASTFAVAPGGPDCGWGNMLFEGQSGLGSHFVALITNGTSGNATFGMTSGTNGCDTSGALTYGGESMLAMDGVMEEVAQNMASGDGEALNALAVSMGIEKADRGHFNAVMHDNFAAVFPNENVTAEQVMQNIVRVMEQDDKLSAYVA